MHVDFRALNRRVNSSSKMLEIVALLAFARLSEYSWFCGGRPLLVTMTNGLRALFGVLLYPWWSVPLPLITLRVFNVHRNEIA
jgi:hypothetical protein